jgi:hypothetical protein
VKDDVVVAVQEATNLAGLPSISTVVGKLSLIHAIYGRGLIGVNLMVYWL